jgi:hypothetical protein
MTVVLVAAASHVENGNKMTQHTGALKKLNISTTIRKVLSEK